MNAPGPEKVELTLAYEDERWRAQGGGIDVAHPELGELDALILKELAAPPVPLRVHVRFDASRLPTWLRQYQAHYFNYVLTVPPRPRP